MHAFLLKVFGNQFERDLKMHEAGHKEVSEKFDIYPIQASDKIITEDEIKDFIETLPRGFLQGVDRIYQDAKYNPPSGMEQFVVNANAGVRNNDKYDIVFTANTLTKTSQEIKTILKHELVHANLRSGFLEPKFFVSLMFDALKRLESPDRFNSPYIQGLITQAKPLYTIVREYLPEITVSYLSNPSRLSPEDLSLAKAVVLNKATDYQAEAEKSPAVVSKSNMGAKTWEVVRKNTVQKPEIQTTKPTNPGKVRTWIPVNREQKHKDNSK